MKNSIPTTTLQNDHAFLDFLSATVRSMPSGQMNKTPLRAPHPTAGELYDYALGWLTESAASRVRAHLAGCGTCAREVLRLAEIETELGDEAVAWTEQTSPGEAMLPDMTTQIKAALETAGDRVIRWISDLWEPQWAGQLLTASDLPVQTHVFPSEFGEIELSCDWHDQTPHEPAALHVIWKAHFTCEQTLWLCMIEPETGWRYYEVCLGNRWAGEEYFTSAELGFNPVEQRWALAVLLSDAAV